VERVRFGAFYALFMTPEGLIVTQHKPNENQTGNVLIYEK